MTSKTMCAADPPDPDPDDAMALELIAADLRWLDRLRHESNPASVRDLLRAYDERLCQAGALIGVPEHIRPLEGMDRELERVRVEAALQENNTLTLLLSAAPLTRVVDTIPRSEREPAAAIAATRLVDSIVRILPPAHRARYAEEFRSELSELDAAGASVWRQLTYVACQFNMVFELRAELRRPARRKAGS
jgi:hypothetical protein